MTFNERFLEIANKSTGDSIRSGDWNDVVQEVHDLGEQTQQSNEQIQNLNTQAQQSNEQIQNLESSKFDRNGGTITGDISFQNNTSGQDVGRLTSNPDGSVFLSSQRGRLFLGGSANTTSIQLTGAFGGSTGIGEMPRGGPSNILHVRGSAGPNDESIPNNRVVTALDSVDAYTALVESVTSRGGPLAIRLSPITTAELSRRRTLNRPFISFFSFEGADLRTRERRVGSIVSGNGSVIFGSPSADYAEYLPRLHPEEPIAPGEIVGVFGGKITKVTEGAHRIMAITDRPIVLGNMPESGQEHLYEQVSFIGQVPIKVRGIVQAGDCIIPSGQNDGVGVAVSPDHMTPDQCTQIVGQAWESSNDSDVKRVNAAVGLDWSSVVATCCMGEIATLRAEMQALKHDRAIAPV